MSVENLINERSTEELKAIAKKNLEKSSARPMGTINMDAVRSVLNGESPRLSVSMYTSEMQPNTVEENEEKEKRHKLFQNLRKEINPTFCPNCNKFMGRNRLDDKFFSLRKMCFECAIKQETELRTQGKWELFETTRLIENKLSFLAEVKEEAIDYLTVGLKKCHEVVNEDGSIQKFTNDDYDGMKEIIESQVVEIEGYITDLNEYLIELNLRLTENSNVN